jgi:hypothetical protein
MSDVLAFFYSIPWFAWIPIVAIICGAVVKVVQMSHRHEERMAMIRAGMRPDPKHDRDA